VTVDMENGFESRAHTVPPRQPSPKWAVDDVVQVDGRRYRIIAISPRGKVMLRQTNNPNGQCYWHTTISKLPRKARA
jgi:hypothetical protein